MVEEINKLTRVETKYFWIFDFLVSLAMIIFKKGDADFVFILTVCVILALVSLITSKVGFEPSNITKDGINTLLFGCFVLILYRQALNPNELVFFGNLLYFALKFCVILLNISFIYDVLKEKRKSDANEV